MLKFTANLSLLFTEQTLLDRFKLAREAGFDAVEIQFPYELSATSIKKQLTRFQLQLVLFNVPADDLLLGGEGLAAVPEKRKYFREAILQTAEYAELLKPEAINVLPGRCLRPEQQQRYLETFKENLQVAIEVLSPLGIKIVFEAINTIDMPGFLIHNGRQMLELLAQMNRRELFMQYDIYHMTRMHQDVETFISTHAANIGHIQFADNPGRGQPGTGQINFASIFKTIEDSAYSGWLGAEYQPVGTTTASLNWFKPTLQG